MGLLSLYNVSTSAAVIVSFLMYFTRVLVGIAGWIIYIKEGKSNAVLSYGRLQSNEADPAIKPACTTVEKSGVK